MMRHIAKTIFNNYQSKQALAHHQFLSALNIFLNLKTGHLFYGAKFEPMPLKFDLIFIRHGETFGNCGQATMEGKINQEWVAANKKDASARIFQGNVDDEINQLTEKGQQQAEEAASKLEEAFIKKDWVPDIIFHSPLKRAMETGLPFVTRMKFHDRYVLHPGLHEMGFGAWENRRVCDFNANDNCHTFYKHQNALVKSSSHPEYLSESFCDVLIRAHQILTHLNEEYANKKVIIFSHSMLGAAFSILLGKGQCHELFNFLAFDGKRSDGKPYTFPHAEPVLFKQNIDLNLSKNFQFK